MAERRVSGAFVPDAMVGVQPVQLAARPAPARVVLVRPPILVPRLALTAPTCPPVGLAYLAGTLRHLGHQVAVVDAVGEAPDCFVECRDPRFLAHGLTDAEIADRVAPGTDVIGVSSMFSHEWPLTRGLIAALRDRCPDALLVVGGEHATAMPGLVLRDCPEVDVIVLGEGEEILAEVVRLRSDPAGLRQVHGVAVRAPEPRGTPIETPRRQRIRAIDDIPPPAWDLVPIDMYLDRGHGFGVNRGRSMPIVATRGCPYQCTFCSNPAMWTTSWIARSPEAVLDEIQGYLRDHQASNIDFYDLTAIVRRSWIVEFCNLILERGLTFTWQLPSGTRSEAIDAEVADLLYRSGCRNISYAPESGSPALLERIKKRVDLKKMKSSMRAAVKAGINCKANIIMGLPGETHADVRKTLRFAAEVAVLGLHDLSITPFSPYPGTELFDELKADHRIQRLDDAYFFSLASYSDLSAAVSYSEFISDAALGRYRMLGMLTFYAVSFLCRPWRIVPIIWHVGWSSTQESRLEMSLRDHLHRRHNLEVGPSQIG